MKISKSKQELARIISENGGWRDGAEFAAQDKDGGVFGYGQKPRMGLSREVWGSDGCTGSWAAHVDTVRNWHQTILSRDEYFHLYPVAETKPELLNRKPTGDGVADDATSIQAILDRNQKPTIEQLAADYRNAKDYAERKQQEADAAKADADSKLKALVIAGEALGLLVSPITAKQEPELATVQVGDEVECIKSNVNPSKYMGMSGTVLEVDDSSTPYLVDFGGVERIWCHKVKFIRRP